jgi:hypothetical protein
MPEIGKDAEEKGHEVELNEQHREIIHEGVEHHE